MTLKGRTSRTILYTTFLVLDLSLFTHVTALYPQMASPGLADGRQSHPASVALAVAGEISTVVQSVHVDGLFELQVVQQPEGDTNYVSSNNGELTQFAAVSGYGNIGLLAHNYLAGRSFSQFLPGQDVYVRYANGETERFVIAEILSYQALDPKSPYSSFQNLLNAQEILSAGQMFDRVYKGDHHLTFQTCIAKEGLSSWGRLFVVARPKADPASFETGMLQTHVSYGP